MRSPRSHPCWDFNATPQLFHGAWMRGVTCSCTSPQRAARAVRTACRVSRAWRRAAPHSPSRGTKRVLTRPGSGARAKTMTTALRLVGVEAGKEPPGGGQKKKQPPPPQKEGGGAPPPPPPPGAPRAHPPGQGT